MGIAEERTAEPLRETRAFIDIVDRHERRPVGSRPRGFPVEDRHLLAFVAKCRVASEITRDLLLAVPAEEPCGEGPSGGRVRSGQSEPTERTRHERLDAARRRRVNGLRTIRHGPRPPAQRRAVTAWIRTPLR